MKHWRFDWAVESSWLSANVWRDLTWQCFFHGCCEQLLHHCFADWRDLKFERTLQPSGVLRWWQSKRLVAGLLYEHWSCMFPIVFQPEKSETLTDWNMLAAFDSSMDCAAHQALWMSSEPEDVNGCKDRLFAIVNQSNLVKLQWLLVYTWVYDDLFNLARSDSAQRVDHFQFSFHVSVIASAPVIQTDIKQTKPTGDNSVHYFFVKCSNLLE